jgi:hypothetical protein
MFCEAVKVDMVNSKDTSFKNTITSTLSLIMVLFEDLFEAITIHKDFCGKKEVPQPSISLLNKTDTCDGHEFDIDIMGQMVLLCTISNDCMAPYWGPRGAYVMS